ncbi:Response regulator MprA [bioreactor metagenome]|jgi:DNA-binding response OmpR family regulator|uniref:Response regulator MprA n=1 Tax=bioreactor metagenome TaxID=1076179 RepID=A0A644W5L5_9ZZZZ|nr:response regulator transcription factor [Bacteroidota bacterium]MEA4867606.1 response regulator transcription factor [Rikenellaceae bacterium]
MKVLIVEDNLTLLDSISSSLIGEKFLCETSADFDTAHEKIFLYEYDIVIVDINLPGGSGLEIIRELKKNNSKTGVIVVSARDSLDNKVEGLELGADDYITKPFEMVELIARIKALMRRRNFAGNSNISYGDITIITDSREVFVKNEKIELTKSEYNILLFFFSNPQRVITKESIAEHIWGDNMDLADSFDFIYSHIKNLRKKITAHHTPDPIKAVYGIGYKLDIPLK